MRPGAPFWTGPEGGPTAAGEQAEIEREWVRDDQSRRRDRRACLLTPPRGGGGIVCSAVAAEDGAALRHEPGVNSRSEAEMLLGPRIDDRARRGAVIRRLSVLVSVALFSMLPVVPQARAEAASPTVQISEYRGFHGCQGTSQPTTTQMQAFWTGTPYAQFYVYMGGDEALCGPGGVTASWISTVLAQGWGLVGIWVGPQCCGSSSGYAHYISTDTTTAYNQGVAEADSAANQWCSWDLCLGYPEPLVYDFETDTDQTAEHAFLSGWDTELKSRLFGYGGYASTCNPTGEVQSWSTVSPVPSFIWPADNNESASVWNLDCLNNDEWFYDYRHHQYAGDHYETWNNVKLLVDDDCANGPVFGELSTGYGDSDTGGEQSQWAEDPEYCLTP